MHPFYEHSGALLARRDSRALGVVSMGAYLVFWAVAIPVALRMLRRALQPVGADVRSGRRHDDAGGGEPDPAVQIVRRRYARGEIDAAELDERLRVLRRQGAPGLR